MSNIEAFLSGGLAMRLISLKSLRPGEILSSPIYSTSGRKILGEGVALTQVYIDRLKNMKVFAVYVEDEAFKDVEIADPIDYTTRNIATQVLDEVITQASMGELFNEYKAKELAKRILEDVKSVSKENINLFSSMVMDDYLITHSITVCILSILIGDKLQYNFNQLWDLAVGSILHDIGRENAAEENPEHVTKGFEILRKCRGLSLMSSIVAYEHHENFDGSGYPRGLKGKNISEFSRIVSIADFYDSNLSTADSENPIMPHEVYEEILANSGKKFDPDIVRVFRDTVAIYPNGCMVLLNNNKKGVVIRQNPGIPQRPVVRLLGQEAKQDDIDLAKNLTVFVKKVILE